ncbi:Cyclic di-GMP phosphodiesterase Gmr [Serratia odorifera]|uniref:Cyclic di-GMP phosphodiesterase Gmr n=1 Tax=Serratia odorifera TaxID=618 RepID=A0A3S4ERD4_SEROD|nr:Cyclic di-GMP phosphodiesterase Gmr [Serratia odorifera]
MGFSERGLIPPLQFISYAEESGLITPLGQWVLKTAARQAADWQRQGLNLRVAVNLSARQLVDDSVVEDLQQVLQENHLTHCPLDFELTESSLIEDENRARTVITRLRQLGAQVHLDDFGTGYSSLAQLARIPLDAIKLDKSFVRGVNLNPGVAIAGARHCGGSRSAAVSRHRRRRRNRKRKPLPRLRWGRRKAGFSICTPDATDAA